MTASLRIALLLALGLYFLTLIGLLKKRSLDLRYTLIWLFSGLLMLIMVIFPQILNVMTVILGFQVGSNALFAMLIFCIMIILMSMTAIASKQKEAIKRLAQYAAQLEKRIRELGNR